jgi:nucleotide-binding universal stress UspA family protein
VLVVDELGEGGERVREHRFLGRSVDSELELARVLDPAIHPPLKQPVFPGIKRAQPGYPQSVDRIIVGYDGSEEAERALERAAELAQALAASLLVVSVARSFWLAETVPTVEQAEAPVPVIPAAAGTGAPLPLPLPEESRPEPKELAQLQLERARMTLTRKRVAAEYLAEVGDAAERLLALGQERGADLIVVGSREHGFLDRLLKRRVDKAVAAHAGCDVLLVH